jgi:hypothetical protein
MDLPPVVSLWWFVVIFVKGACVEELLKTCILHLYDIRCHVNLIIISMALPAHSGPRPVIRFRNHFSQMVGLLGRVISPSQGRYLNKGQRKQNERIHTHTPNIHALSGIRTHNSSVRASEDSSCLRLWPAFDVILTLLQYWMVNTPSL